VKQRTVIAVVLLAIMLAALSGCASVPVAPSTTAHPVVFIVTPPLTWSDISSDETPALTRMAEDAAIGAVVSKDPASSVATLSDQGAGTAQPITTITVTGSPATIDRAIAEQVSSAPAGAAIVVVSAAGAATPGHGASAGIVLVSGGGYGSGLLTSVSTRRGGLVTDSDVAATVGAIAGATDALKAGIAASVLDDGRMAADRVAWLARVSVFLTAVEKIRVPIFNVYTAAMVVLLLGGWFVAERYRTAAKYAYWSLVLRRFIVLGLVFPVGGTLLHVADRLPDTPQRVVSLLLAASGLLWIFAEFAWHKWGTAGAIAFSGLAAALILGIDQLAGATLSLSSIFSYSPLIGFRFFGIGNEGAAILFGGALVGLSLELDAAKSSARVRRISIAGVGAAAVIVCAAPFFGANVIVAVWGTATFAAFWLAAERRRIRTADMLFALALVGAAFAAMVALDRYTGGTHIGRAVGEVAGGGLGALLAERFATSLRIFMDSPLPAIVLIIATILAYMRLRPRGRMAVVLGRYPVFAAAMTAGLLGGFIGALTEDSGVVVLALVITYLVGGLVALMLEPDGSVVA